MNKSKQGILLSLIIILVCSITPATAIQNGETNTNGDISDWDVWIKGVELSLDVMGGQEDTELTLEQETYVETHQDRIQIKGESVLYQLQAYMDYINKELSEYKYNTNPTNTQNTPLSATNVGATHVSATASEATTSMKDIKTELKKEDILVNNTTTNYTALSDAVNGVDGNNPTLDKSTVIVPIKDCGYLVYAELININYNEISIKTSQKDIKYSADVFKNYHSADGNLNIIIVPPEPDREDILTSIYGIQRNDLITHSNWYVAGISACGVAIGSGVSLIVNGLIQIRGACKTKIKKITISEYEGKDVEEGGEEVGKNGEANIPVLRYGSFKQKVENEPGLKKYLTPSLLIGVGIAIVATGGALSYYSYNLKTEYDNERAHLEKWG
ncbi:hypothetical protein [Methanobacterium sp. SMA-27]|uniref:hypothetical protein n=1 Tax=Methanobacterium sp. SMA-27 TaxID=1495336 RepID=UPI00064F015D|nr:hypothetical protein [Methanobacterium sp. SMA-27]